MKKIKSGIKGFTLLELLVVVLIIGILAAIALPQYREAVEKSIMQEAIVNLKTIASAQDRFYLINNRYAGPSEIDKLDIEIPGEIKEHAQTGLWGNRVVTKYFIYGTMDGSVVANAHRIKDGITDYQNDTPYYIMIRANTGRLTCVSQSRIANATQVKLCTKINSEGLL